MTLLHQAAQKAVEACDDSSTVQQIDAPDAGPIPEICDGMDKAAVWSYAHLCGYRAALQQQPEPVACLHKGDHTPKWDHIVCDDCGAVQVSGADWGIASRKWFQSLEVAKFYRDHGRLPALQHQEEPREPVAPTDDEILAIWREVRLEDESYLGLRIRFARALLALYASPSTTQQQEVGSGCKLVPVEPTPEMIAAYLRANDAYWKRTDELPTPPNKWRTGTPSEATAESYRAMLAASPSTTRQQEVGSGAAFCPCSFCDSADACRERGCADAAYGREVAGRRAAAGGHTGDTERVRCVSCEWRGLVTDCAGFEQCDCPMCLAPVTDCPEAAPSTPEKARG
jgi:hypothetical protein